MCWGPAPGACPRTGRSSTATAYCWPRLSSIRNVFKAPAIGGGLAAPGRVQGFARRTRDSYLPHDQPKELLVKALHPRALQWLKAPHLPEPWVLAQQTLPPHPSLRLAQWQSLYELFADLPDARSPHGRLHSLRTIVTIAAAAVMAGARGYLAISEFAVRLYQRQLAAVRAYVDPKTDRRVAPGYNAIWRVLTHLDANGLDQRLHQWFSQLDPQLQTLAVDGKTLRGTAVPTANLCTCWPPSLTRPAPPSPRLPCQTKPMKSPPCPNCWPRCPWTMWW